MDEFKYSPLQAPESDIRLIAIRSRSNLADPPECILRTFVGTSSCPEYTAISYTWGDESLKKPIQLNGKTKQVTANLESALRYLRPGDRKGYSLFLWIDALCINQANLQERNQQVQRMRDIYRDAKNVTVWLGEEHEPEDDKLVFRPDIWGSINPRVASGYHLSTAELSVAFQAVAKASNGYTVEFSRLHSKDLFREFMQSNVIWAMLAQFFKREWFERLWIIQEVEVAAVVFFRFGQDGNISWAALESIVNHILRPLLQIPNSDQRVFPLIGADRFTNISLQGIDRSNILTVLRRTRATKCKDPRDRLYAIKGIVDDNQDIEVDYSSSVESVYLRWAIRRIERTGSLDILSACGHSGRNGLPSWVPDLRMPWGNDRPLFCRTHGLEEAKQQHRYNASWGISYSLKPFPLPIVIGERLHVSGSILQNIRTIGTIADVTQNLVDPTKLREGLLNSITSWETMCVKAFGADLAPTYSTAGLPVFSTGALRFADALLRGYVKWGDEQHPASLMERFHVWRYDLPVPWNYLYSNPEYTSKLKFLENFERILFTMVHDCRMFISSQWTIGIVGSECRIQEDDQICTFHHGATLYILRKETSDIYKLVGPCYLSQYMGLPKGPGVAAVDGFFETFGDYYPDITIV